MDAIKATVGEPVPLPVKFGLLECGATWKNFMNQDELSVNMIVNATPNGTAIVYVVRIPFNPKIFQD